MDAVSYSLASKQAQRIEKFIENPDSTSGIVTVPKTIASGETITIPSGRVAVLPNVVVDGDLVVEDGGEVFVPAGAGFSDLENQIALKAPLTSPVFTGTPTAPTAPAGTNSTQIATTAYVDGKMVLGITVTTISGTVIDFVGIPSGVKRISIFFKGVSTNGNSGLLVQIGNTTVQTTGYLSSASGFINGTLPSTYVATSGFIVFNDNIADSNNIKMTIDLMNNFTYISTHNGVTYDVRLVSKNGSGVVSLSSALDRIRITSVSGSETFDSGQINIMYER